MSRTTIILLLCGLLIACSDTAIENAIDEPLITSSERFDRTRNKAKLALEAAAAVSTEWLSTASLLEKADRAAQQKNWEAAILLAQQSLQQSEMSLQQSKSEAEVWRSRVIK